MPININRRVSVVRSVLIVLANDITLGPPIHWIICCFVVGVISLGSLINLLDGLPLKCGFQSLGFVVWIFGSLEILLEDSVSWLKVPPF